MGRSLSFIAGAAIGVMATTVLAYLLGPAREAHFDERYRSRWDQALEDGKQAAAEHEVALRQQLATAKQPRLPI